MVSLVQHYFSASSRRFPNKAALNCADQSSSYSESEKLTNAIANQLRRDGLVRGSFVPFFMAKSINSIHAVLSILKADCAYVPIDINSPGNRIQSILDACDASLVVVDSTSRSLFEDLVPAAARPNLLVIDEFEGGDETEPDYQNLSIDIAYVLFTSGSTGVPKGVMIPHKAIIDYIDWCVDEYDLTDKDVVANHAPLYFDNSTFDIYTAFKAGTELHLVDDAVNDFILALIKWIDERGITTFFCVPSVLSMLLRTRRLKSSSFSRLRHLICAGEVLPPDVLRAWMELYPHVHFTNMYGPTEITVDCSYHVVSSPPGEGELAVPIGRARPNMELFVREESGTLSKKVGARGELLVRGTAVAYGYLGDEEKTRKAFIQNPNNRFFHDPLYCTGDLVEINPNREFLFLGRADDQIKYLGYRIELGEIEAQLTSVEGVDECIVVFNDAVESSDQAIGALISSVASIGSEEISAALKKQLPSYMVPGILVFSNDDFPRTANGKYDRQSIRSLVFGGLK